MTAWISSPRPDATAARMTAPPRRTAPTPWGSPCCSTSSTTTSAPTAATWPASAPPISPTGTGRPGDPRSTSDGPGSEMVRAFFIENALHWIHEYHMDGLRLDATHSMVDEGPRHFLAELSARVREHGPDRPIHLIAEDHRNLAGMLRPESAGGWGLDGVWSDDFHHQLRRLLCGDDDGVYRDFAGTIPDLVTTLNRGWLFTGEYSIHRGKNRGTDPAGLPLRSFVFCIQNHDRIGNRAFGERLNHQVDRGDLSRGLGAVAPGAADSPALHGPGMGGLVAVPLLHRPRAGAGPSGARGTPPRVPILSGVSRGGGTRTDPRPAGRSDVPRLAPRLVRTRPRAACGDIAVVPGSARAASQRAGTSRYRMRRHFGPSRSTTIPCS